jgi:glutaconate CoA-transferase subunit B
MALLGYDEQTRRMKVLSINPGHTREEIQEATGFELLWADDLAHTEEPTEGELRILREEIDTEGYFVGRAAGG